MEYTYKAKDNRLVETIIEEKVTVVEYNLNELIKIRESIDVSEAEYLAKIQAEKDKYDALISEAKKKGLKESKEVVIAEETVVE